MKNKGCLTIIGGILIFFVSIIVILGMWISNIYNDLIQKDELIINKWSKVESAYQRRSDLIPNLVNTVKGYAKFEQETLIQVINMRSKATQIIINPKQLNSEIITKFQKCQDAISSSLSKLLVSIERYPELKANSNFLELQSELSGTENRIKIERDQFNDAVMEYNQSIRKIPNKLIAQFFKFYEKKPFKSEEHTKNTPKVNF